MNRIAIAAALLAAMAVNGAKAQEGVTVAGLLKDGYEVKGVFPSNAGPGLVLEKGSKVVICFVAEKPKSATVATEYCKPVE
jgi:hypothetical protein